MQVAEVDALEARNLAGRGLLVGHHGFDQAVEIDVLDVERLAHVIAAGPQDLEDLRFILRRIELCFDGIRPGHDQAEGEGRGEHLDEDRFHVFDRNSGTASPDNNYTKRRIDGGESARPAKINFGSSIPEFVPPGQYVMK